MNHEEVDYLVALVKKISQTWPAQADDVEELWAESPENAVQVVADIALRALNSYKNTTTIEVLDPDGNIVLTLTDENYHDAVELALTEFIPRMIRESAEEVADDDE